MGPLNILSNPNNAIAITTNTNERIAAAILLNPASYCVMIAQVKVSYLNNATAPKSLNVYKATKIPPDLIAGNRRGREI